MENKRNWLYEVDLLRIIAILFVVISHFNFLLYNTGWILACYKYLAMLGAGTFFFVSGFTIHMNNAHINSARDVLTFFRKRVLKIIPLYWLAVVSFYVLYSPLNLGEIFPGPYHDFSLTSILVHLMGLQTFYGHFLPAMWFIGILLIFYLIYPFLIKACKNNLAIVLATIIVTMAFIAIAALGIVNDNNLYFYFPVFMFGVLAHRADILKYRKNVKSLSLLLITTGISLLAYIYVFGAGSFSLHSFSPYNVILYVAYILTRTFLLASLCVMAYWLMKAITERMNPRQLRGVTLLSNGSYATYLFHLQLLVLILAILSWLGATGLYGDALMIVIGLPASLVLGVMIQKSYDYIARMINTIRTSQKNIVS